MQEKEMYTLKELYDNLEVPYAKLGKLADMSEGTVTRIRDGYPARRTTLNRLLRAFSQVYGRQLTLENVTGLQIEDKHKPEKVEKPPEETNVVQTVNHIAPAPTSPTIAKKEKRPYKKKTDLPEGAMLAIDFGRNHGVKRETFRDHMVMGLGPGTIPGEETSPTLGVRDHVDYSERPKPGREHTGEKERYLTTDQQKAALEFWQRHKVDYGECDRPDCQCHTLKGKQ